MRELYYNIFISTYGNQWKIQIYDSTLSAGGTPEELTSEGEGFELEHDSGYNDVKLNPIHTSKLNFYVYNEPTLSGNILDSFLINLRTKEEGTYLIKLSKYNGSTYNYYWGGYLLQDFGGWNDSDREAISLQATDGIGMLKDIQIDTATLNGYNSYALINYALKQLNTVDFWGTNDEFIRIKTNWSDSRINANPGSEDSLIYTKVNLDVFVKFEEFEGYNGVKITERKVESYYNLIYKILYSWNCEIKLINGYWRIYQKALLNNSVSYRGYKKDETLHGSGTDAIVKIIDQVNFLRSNINFSYYPPIKEFRVKFKQREGGNLLPTTFLIDTYYNLRPVESGNNQVDFSGLLHLFNAVFTANVCISVLNVYIKVEPTAGSTYYYDGTQWTTTASFIKVYGTMLTLGDNITPKVDYSNINFRVLTNGNIPVSGDLSVKISVGNFENAPGSSITVSSYDYNFIDLECFYIENNQDVADYIQFTATNPDGYNLIIEMDDSDFGSSGIFTGKGRIKTTNGTSFDYAEDFEIVGTSPALDFNKLLVREVMKQHNHANLILSGDIILHSYLDAQNTLQLAYNAGTYKFTPNRVTYKGNSDTITGDWIECDYDNSITVTLTDDEVNRFRKFDFSGQGVEANFSYIREIYRYLDFYDGTIKAIEIKDILNITSNTTLVQSQAVNWILADTSSGNVTITLPDSSTLDYNTTYEITYTTGGNTLTIACDGSDTFPDTSTSFEGVLNETYKLRIDTSNGIWRTV